MIDRNLLKEHVQALIDKHVLSEEVENDLEAVILVIDEDPVVPEYDHSDGLYHCPVCGGELDGYVGEFCQMCGRRLEWDGA